MSSGSNRRPPNPLIWIGAGVALIVVVLAIALRPGPTAGNAPGNGPAAAGNTVAVGENAPAIRAATVTGLGFLGLAIDGDRNGAPTGDREIGPVGAASAVLVVASREDLEIARQVRVVLGR